MQRVITYQIQKKGKLEIDVLNNFISIEAYIDDLQKSFYNLSYLWMFRTHSINTQFESFVPDSLAD